MKKILIIGFLFGIFSSSLLATCNESYMHERDSMAFDSDDIYAGGMIFGVPGIVLAISSGAEFAAIPVITTGMAVSNSVTTSAYKLKYKEMLTVLESSMDGVETPELYDFIDDVNTESANYQDDEAIINKIVELNQKGAFCRGGLATYNESVVLVSRSLE